MVLMRNSSTVMGQRLTATTTTATSTPTSLFTHDADTLLSTLSPAGDLTDMPLAVFPIYIPSFVGVIPLFLIGILLNAIVMSTILRNKQKLLVTRLDQVMLLLIIVFFFWSLVCLLEFIAAFAVNSAKLYIAEALERFAIVARLNELTIERAFTAVIIVVGIVCGVILTVFVRTAIDMDHSELIETWIMTMYAILLAITLAVIVLYAASYFKSAHLVRESLGLPRTRSLKSKIKIFVSRSADPEASDSTGGLDSVSIQVERRLLLNSIAMASSLVVCYLPGIIFQFLPAFVHLSPEASVALGNFSELTLSSDMIVTPVLILYFRPDIRDVLFQGWLAFRERFGRRDSV